MARKKNHNKGKKKGNPKPVHRKRNTNEIKAEETDQQQFPIAETPPRFERFMDLPPSFDC